MENVTNRCLMQGKRCSGLDSTRPDERMIFRQNSDPEIKLRDLCASLHTFVASRCWL